MNAKTQDVDQGPPPIANADGIEVTDFTAVAAMLPRNPLDQLSIQLAELVKAIKASESNKPSGDVTLTVKVKRADNVLDAVVISVDVKSKLPKEPKLGGLLFADDDGKLTDRNPNQREMFTGPRG